jgi:hypothetical protein
MGEFHIKLFSHLHTNTAFCTLLTYAWHYLSLHDKSGRRVKRVSDLCVPAPSPERERCLPRKARHIPGSEGPFPSQSQLSTAVSSLWLSWVYVSVVPWHLRKFPGSLVA